MGRTAATCHPDRPTVRHGLCNSCHLKDYRAANRDKIREWARGTRERRKARDPDYDRRAHARNRVRRGEQSWRYHQLSWYGLTAEEYDSILEEQHGVCAICQRPERATYRGKIRRLAVDHVHGSEPVVVRGLLCAGCNSALGNLGDTPELLRRALVYLERAD